MSHVIAVDLFAFLLVVIGFHLAFRQGQVRRWWRRLNPGEPGAPPRQRKPGDDEDPAHYAMMIAGVMVMAFGLILGALTTAYWLMTASLAP